MTDPVAFELFGRPIYWYGVFFALGFVAAVVHWSLLGRRAAVRNLFPPGTKPGELAADMALWVMVGGVVGARLAYVIANWEAEFASHPAAILRIDQGGLIYYGGFVGGILGGALFARRRRQPAWVLGDFMMTALPLGHAFGRFGCFLNGCCYGRPCAADAFYAVRYAPGTAPFAQYHPEPMASALASLPLYPAQLFEVGANLLLFAILVAWYLRNRIPGRVTALYLLIYPVSRFLNEFFRGDVRLGEGVNAAQVISLLLFIAGGALWFAAPRFGRSRDAAAGG